MNLKKPMQSIGGGPFLNKKPPLSFETPTMPKSPGKQLPIKQMPGGKGQLRQKLSLDAINRRLQG